MAKDFYQELGVSRTATDDEIRRAYRKLAAKFHPDKNPGDASAEARFKDINRAHEVLSDRDKRSLYDRYGEAGLREGFRPGMGGMGRGRPGSGGLEDMFGGGGAGIGDIFGEMFGGGGGRGVRGRAAQALKGADVAAEVTVGFVDAVRGTSVKLSAPGSAGETTVRIPPGAGNGDKVRVAGHGAPGRFGGPPGDLLITIQVSPHEFFEREGLDLTLDLPISVGEAYRGAKVSVPTPSGEVTLKVPPKSQSGQRMRLPGKGVARKNHTGDLYVRFLIKLPDSDAAEVENAVDVLTGATDASLRDGLKF